MTSYPRVDELTSPPVVGEIYLVPSVRISPRRTWYPVFGTVHTDPDLGAADPHFHYDVRHMTDAQMRYVLMGRLPYEQHRTRVERLMTRVLKASSVREGPVLVPMRCLREMPDQAELWSHRFEGETFVRELLERQYLARRLKCGRCPHRGMDVRSLPVKNGLVVCAGHGLAFSVATGRCVERAAGKAGA